MANDNQEKARGEGGGADSDPNDLEGREPILVGLCFYDPAAPENYRLSNRGGCLLSAEQREGRLSLLRLILASARHLNHDVPDMFTPDAAEVFYTARGLEEVRLEGRCVMGVDLDGEIRYEPVTIGAKVGFNPRPRREDRVVAGRRTERTPGRPQGGGRPVGLLGRDA